MKKGISIVLCLALLLPIGAVTAFATGTTHTSEVCEVTPIVYEQTPEGEVVVTGGSITITLASEDPAVTAVPTGTVTCGYQTKELDSEGKVTFDLTGLSYTDVTMYYSYSGDDTFDNFNNSSVTEMVELWLDEEAVFCVNGLTVKKCIYLNKGDQVEVTLVSGPEGYRLEEWNTLPEGATLSEDGTISFVVNDYAWVWIDAYWDYICDHPETKQYSDMFEHWEICQDEKCFDYVNQGAHIPGPAATETEAQTCTVCGYVLTPATGKPVAPQGALELNIANGPITITATGYSRGGEETAYTGSYVLTGTANTNGPYNTITVSGLAEGGTILLKDLDITTSGPDCVTLKNVRVMATGTVKLTNTASVALGGTNVNINGDADILLTGNGPAVASDGKLNITCNSLTATSSGSTGISAGSMNVVAAEDITVSGNPAIGCSATLRAGGDITIQSNQYGAVSGVLQAIAGGDFTASSATSGAPVISDFTTVSAGGAVSITNSGTGMAISGCLKVVDSASVSMTANCYSPAISGYAEITSSGNVTLENTKGITVGAYLEANTPANLTVKSGSTGGPAIGAYADLDVGGDVTLECAGAMALSSYLEAIVGGDLTVKANTGSPAIGSYADLTVTGNLLIENPNGMVGVDITAKAANITVTGKTDSSPMITGTADLTATGDITLENTSTGWVVYEDLTAEAENITISNSDAATYPLVEEDMTLTAKKAITLSTGHTAMTGGTQKIDCGTVLTTTVAGETDTEDFHPQCAFTVASDQLVSDATCTQSALYKAMCEVCDAVSEDKTIPVGEPNGHAWGKWTQTKAPEVGVKGEARRDCDNCDAYETRDVDALPEEKPEDPKPSNPTDPSKPEDEKPEDPTTPSEPEKIENPFVDITEDMFCYDAVLWAYENEITTGKDATHFNPSGNCTRSQVVTFLWRAAGKPAPKSSENPFPDVATGKFYTEAVLWAVENGITAGFKDGTFGPDKTCTRDQIVTFLWRFAGEPEPKSTENTFPDVKADAFYTDAVLWAVENGITTGYKDGTFGPSKTCKRDQIVTFLYRYMAE